MRSITPNDPPRTPSHPPPALPPDLALAGAPVKASGGRGFPSPSVEDQVKNSPSQSAEKVARKKGRASTSTPSGGGAKIGSPGEANSRPRRSSFSLSFTPIRPVADKTDFDSAASSPAVLAKQQQEFQSAMQTSNSKAHAYVAPHRRSSSSSTTTPSSYSPKSLSYYDHSGLPPAEDSYYSSSPSHSNSRSSYASARTSLGSLASSISPHIVGTNNISPSPSYTHKSRYANDFPPPAPASAIISRGPYDDPPRHPHPLAIPESAELESNDTSSWADEVEEYERSMGYDDEVVEYEPPPSEWSRRPSLADGEEVEFLVRIGKRKSSSAFITSSGIDVPSPVWEEHFDEEELRIPISASASRKVDIPKSRKVLIGSATTLDSDENDEDVCTGCGTPPIPSFVALVPCDHLVCHTCLNALINAAAHKPPRPMACFACGSHVDSFLPAWEGVGAAAGGRIGLVEALQESLRNGEGRKPIATDPIAPPAGRRGEKRSRRSSSSATATIAAVMKVEEGKENMPEVAKDGQASTKNRKRSSSSGSTVSVVGHGAHLLSPLSLKSKKSRSVLASGSLSQVEYEAESSTSPLRSRSDSSATANASKTHPSTPSRPPLKSRSNSFSLPRSRRNSRSSHSPSHTRYGTDETEMDPATPDLSTSFTPYKLVEAMGSGPQTPVAFGGAEAQVLESGGPAWSVQDKIKSSQFTQVDYNAEAPLAPIEWPVVRLDNIPWDITVAEVEDWLPAETLAPFEQCVMAVHILCNRSDGRTLNQCYVEAASVAAARTIVRSRDGKKMRHRPVHVTLSSQGEFLNTIFPTYDPGFVGLRANKCITPCPLLMQTELTGLLSLCKLESPHAAKIKERPYFNVISVLQKFPWYQPETWNSQQIVRLYNTACAAVEILDALQDEIPEWLDILTALADAVVACPAFRPHQKAKLIKKTGFPQSRYPSLPLNRSTRTHTSSSGFSFSPPSLRETFVTVNHASLMDEGSPSPSHLLNLAPGARDYDYDSDMTSPTSSPKRSLLALPSSARLSKTTSAPNLFSPGYTHTNSAASPQKKATPGSSKHRRVSSIAKQLGVDDQLVKAVVEQLGLGGGGRL